MDFGLRLVLSPDETNHSHSNSELVYVIRGGCYVFGDSRKIFLKNEDMIYIHSGKLHRCVGKSEDSFIAKMTFSPQISSRLNGVDFCSLVANDETILLRIKNIFMKILWEEHSGLGEESFHRSSLCYELLHILETYYKNPVEENDVTGQIKTYIYQHYMDDISLQSLADEFHFSSAYLSRMFKQRFGMNFINYLNQLRLEQASDKIAHSDGSITAIALQHGFSSISSFYKLFKDEYGLQPTEYRKKHQEEKENVITEENAEIKAKYLKEHLQYMKKEEKLDAGNEFKIEADIGRVLCLNTDMNSIMNIGPLNLYSDIAFGKGLVRDRIGIGMKFLRVWGVLPENIFGEEVKNEDFALLDQFLKFCQNEGMIPYIEIGRPNRWWDKPFFDTDQIKQNLKRALDMIVNHVAMSYKNFLPIYFEMRMFEGGTGLCDEECYFEMYRYFRERVNVYMQNAKVGGAGAELLDHLGREEEVLTPWLVEGISPDFLSFKIHPYTVNAQGYRKAVADPDCIKKAFLRLKNAMQRLSFETIPIHANYVDSFYRRRSYLNDSLWKANFMLKVYQESLGSGVQFLAFGRWMDGIEEPGVNTYILNGGNGMVCRNGVEKPAYGLLRTMCAVGNQIIASEPGCIITKISGHRLRVILYNYRHLNYLYYANEEQNIDIKDTEMFLEKPRNKTFHLNIRGLEDHRYLVRDFSFTKERSSVLDAWIANGGECSKRDSRWLEFYCSPDVHNMFAYSSDGTMSLDFVLKPLEFKGIEIVFDTSDELQ